MSGNIEGSGMKDVNLAHYAANVSCMVCQSSFSVSEAVSLAQLSDKQRGLVMLSGIQTEYDAYICRQCLASLDSGKKDFTGLLNSFAHLESYHEIMQAFGRAYLGAFIVSNLFVSTHVLPAVIGALVFAMCPWSILYAFLVKIVTFPPLGIALLFVPWAVIVYFGTNPISFAQLIDDPGQYFPWTKVTFLHENYIEGVFIGMAIVGILYVFALFSSDYLLNIDEEALMKEENEEALMKEENEQK